MYIHPLPNINRDLVAGNAWQSFQSLSTNGTTPSSVSQSRPHPTGYLVLAVVLAILLLSLAGVFIARRRVGASLPCSAARRKGTEKTESPPRMQREGYGRSRFTDGFDIMPSLHIRPGTGSGSSRTPSSSYSEGPSTPSAGEEHEHGDLGTNGPISYEKDEHPFVPIPIIVHTPTQTHQTTFLTGPDVPSPDLTAPTAHHEHFFDEHLPTNAHGSVIRPHGLPLSPVPEESSAILSFSSTYFEVDEETLYGTTSDPSPAH